VETYKPKPGKTPHKILKDVELPKSVVIAYSYARRGDFPTEAQYITEKGAEEGARLVGETLEALGVMVQLLPGNAALPQRLRKLKPDLVVNLVDSVKGVESLAAAIPGTLELLGLPYTGSDMLGLSLDSNKFLVKKLLQQNGVPVPYFQLFNAPGDRLDPLLRFPLISKLNAIHGSVEITRDAVSEDEKHLRKRLRRLIRTYKQPVLVEEFISGREMTAIVLQADRKQVYLAEKVFAHPDEPYVFLTFEDQWLTEAESAFHYRDYADPILNTHVKKAFAVMRMAGYAKFDVRMDQSGRYFFVDCNSNPELGPKEHDVAISVILDLHGVPFEEVMRQIVLSPLRTKARKARRPKVRYPESGDDGKQTAEVEPSPLLQAEDWVG
jgi:D-alanine-D-alanine ligase